MVAPFISGWQVRYWSLVALFGHHRPRYNVLSLGLG